MDKLKLTKINFEELPEAIQFTYDFINKNLQYDNMYKTNRPFVILEDEKRKRIYIDIFIFDQTEEYEGLTIEELNYLIDYFNIEEAHVFDYPYSYEDSMLCIGKREENERLY